MMSAACHSTLPSAFEARFTEEESIVMIIKETTVRNWCVYVTNMTCEEKGEFQWELETQCGPACSTLCPLAGAQRKDTLRSITNHFRRPDSLLFGRKQSFYLMSHIGDKRLHRIAVHCSALTLKRGRVNKAILMNIMRCHIQGNASTCLWWLVKLWIVNLFSELLSKIYE